MDIQKNVPLAPFTTFHIGGPADFFISTHSANELIDALQFAIKNNLSFFVLGTGANILIGDKGFRGLVIKNETKKFHVIEREKNILFTAESGVTVEELINYSAKEGISGFEHFAGIPSTVGGALWQNLHFLSPDRKSTVFIGDITESAVVFDSGGVKTVSKEYFNFSYDYSSLHDNQDVVLSATFRVQKEDPQVIKNRIAANLTWREEKHPSFAWRVSAGSVFKKIEGYGAGRLIEQVGLKGFQIGGAQISPKHANFIVNTGNAKAQDVRDLINLVQKKVKEQLGLNMITEISFIGEF